MATISYVKPELIVALNKKIIFVNPNDMQIFKDVNIPEDLTKCGLVRENAKDAVTKKNEIHQEKPIIRHVKLSPNGLFLAVTTTGQKALILYQCRLEHAKLLSVRPVERASSALAFSADSKTLLVTDKTGDCYSYDCERHDELPKLILGHLSIVFDVIFTDDQKHIITCDRDDKIRVTNYPNCYEIHGYCLGHKEFVSGIQLLGGQAGDVIASISGDKTLQIWNYINGKQLAEIEMPAPGIKFSLRKLNEETWHAAVLVFQPNESVFVYQITKQSGECFEIKEVSTHSFDSVIITNLCYVEERLFLTGIRDDHFTLAVIGGVTPDKWIDMVEETFSEYAMKPDDVSEWFKKKYDNVTDYLERKKRRIEEKKCK